ncbi:MAG: DUF1266 domain-containing protein [Planctomycetes bacterium]|nr:DUF1266 domain-containing protein [Planctomycetota bacterium]
MNQLLGLLLAVCALVPVPLDTPPDSKTPPMNDAALEAGTSRAWALLPSAILFERNGMSHVLLGGGQRDAKYVATVKAMLNDSWEIKTEDDLITQLEWLKSEGHRKAFTRRFKEVAKLSEKDLEKSLAKLKDDAERANARTEWNNAKRALALKGGVIAWDYARAIALCRWGYAAGMLSEEDVWKRVEPFAKELQAAYASWEEMNEAFLIGREAWHPGGNAETVAAYEKLAKSESSPFKSTPWNLKLVKLDKPEKRKDPVK